MIVELNGAEAGYCWQYGQKRHIAFVTFYKHDNDMLKRINTIEAHAAHCKGEFAAAKLMGVDARGVVKDEILAGHVRVRGDPDGHLLIGMQEKPDIPVIHVRMLGAKIFEVFGWIWVGEARRPEWLSNYRGHMVHQVPSDKLYDMKTFPRQFMPATPEDVP